MSDIEEQEVLFREDEIFISYTDLDSRITYGNDVFLRLSGYSKEELIGTPHNIIRHQDMPKIVFKLFWDFVKNGKVITAYVKNRAKDGSFYWVCATAYGVRDCRGEIKSYMSVRIKPTTKYFDIIKDVYKELLECEKSAGSRWEEECLALFTSKLKSLGYKSYEELMQDILNEELSSKEDALKPTMDINSYKCPRELYHVYQVSEILYKSIVQLSSNINELKNISNTMITNTKDITYSLSDTTLSAQNSAIMSTRLGEKGRVFSAISQYIQNLSFDGKVLSDAIDENVHKMNDLFVKDEQIFVRATLIRQTLILVKIELKDLLDQKSKNMQTLVDAKDFMSFNINEDAIYSILGKIRSLINKMNTFAIELKAISNVGKIEATKIDNNSINSVLSTIDEVVKVLNISSEKSGSLFVDMNDQLEHITHIFKEIYVHGTIFSLYIMAYQHQLFVNNVKNLVSSKKNEIITTHTTCAFGKFYYGGLLANIKELKNIEAEEYYKKIEPHHIEVHKLGQKALDLASKNSEEELHKTMIRLEEDKESVIRNIFELIDSMKDTLKA